MQITSIKYTETKKPYFSVLNEPFLLIGTQIRLDGLLHRPVKEEYKNYGVPPKSLTMKEIESYFSKAMELGFNTVQVPIDWRFIEVKENEYSFDLLETILLMAEKYKLKIEYLWFSTNMCGDSHSNHLPDYIFDNSEKYPRMEFTHDNIQVTQYFHMMYGYSAFLVLDNKELMKRETLVLEAITNYLYERYLRTKSATVISFQIHNEPDGFVRWRIDQHSPILDNQYLSKERAWEMTLISLNNAAKAIKESNYKVITRTNMTVSLDMDSFKEYPKGSAKDVKDLEYIDIVGDDPYVETPLEIKKSIISYSQKNNYPHIAENMGNYQSTPQLLLQAYLNGASYSVYDMATPEYFIWMNKGSEYQMDQGLINPDFSNKLHTHKTTKIIKGIKKASSIFALKDINNFFGFNTNELILNKSLETDIILNDVNIKIITNHEALGYIFSDGLYIYVYMTDKFTLSFLNKEIEVVNTGEFIKNCYISLNEIKNTSDYDGEELYRFTLK